MEDKRRAAPGRGQFIWNRRNQCPRRPRRGSDDRALGNIEIVSTAGSVRQNQLRTRGRDDESRPALRQTPDLNLADVAYTLSQGRKAFSYRRTAGLFGYSARPYVALESNDPKRVFTNLLESGATPVTFMFSGQGAQYVNMGSELYQVESDISRTGRYLR